MPEPPSLYGSIDIGTNSVKMIVADLSNGQAIPIFEQSITTRLGEGMQAQTKRLREVPIRRALETLAQYVVTLKALNVCGIACVGTAALRDAENADDFIRRAQDETGLTVEVISGEEEARLSFLAVRRDPHWRNLPLLDVIDVGGGSTEVIQGLAGTDRLGARLSVNLGAVKLTESYLKSDPPTVAQLEAANRAAAEGFARVTVLDRPVDSLTPSVVGVGGTLTNLASMRMEGMRDLEKLHGFRLTADALEAQISQLSALTVAQRREIPGLSPERADIILGGAILLSQALARIGSPAVDVSTRGLRWGVLYDRFATSA